MRDLLDGPTLEAARGLIGALLVRDPDARGAAPVTDGPPEELRIGRIVEVEAYVGEDDQASHARFGRTARNAVMYGRSGIAYVYLVYGMHHCLNVVTEPEGRPAAILVRGVEPLAGIDTMRRARAAEAHRRRKDPLIAVAEAERVASMPVSRLASGPGLVAAAFSLDRSHTGLDLLNPASPVRLEPALPGDAAAEVVATPRIGIGYAGGPWVDVPWRFLDPASPAVSGPRSGAATAARRARRTTARG